MTPLLARLGPLEAQGVVRTIWRSGVRVGSRCDWVCGESYGARRGEKLCRKYSDNNGVRWPQPVDGVTFADSKELERTKVRGRYQGRRDIEWNSGQSQDPIHDDGEGQFRPYFDRYASEQTPQDSSSSSPQFASRMDDLWDQFQGRQELDEVVKSEQDKRWPRVAATQNHDLLSLDYKEELSPAMLRGDADVVVRCLLAANQANDLDFLQGIPVISFSEIIRLLQPSNFFAPLASTHVGLSTAMTYHFGVAPMRDIAYEYSTVLRQVVSIRRRSGISATLLDYTILLRSARDLGSQKLSNEIWNAMGEDGHVPTTKCYNHHMSATIWNGMHSGGARQRVRVIPFHMQARRRDRRRTQYKNFRVGEGGVRETAMKLFNEMLDNGVMADEESFCILMTASAREGDIETVKSLLKKVWSIDVDAIVAGTDEEAIRPTQTPIHSPLYPTTKVLFAIAHAFGINNDASTALRTVDFVARHFNLEISSDVWSQLFEWTFVLSIPRYGTSLSDGSTTGQIPAQSVIRLWETMTGPPYLVQPTMGMYDYLIRNLSHRSWTSKMAEKMQEGHELHKLHLDLERQSWKKLDRAIREQEANARPATAIDRLRGDWEHARLITRRNHFWLQRWLCLYLGSYLDSHMIDALSRRFAHELPPLLWEWRRFAPMVVRYHTPTGIVEFQIRSREEILQYQEGRVPYETRKRMLSRQSPRHVGDEWVHNRVVEPPKRLRKWWQLRATASNRMGLASNIDAGSL